MPRYAELLHNKKLREKKGKKGITLRDIASKVHLLARLGTSGSPALRNTRNEQTGD